MFRNSRKTNKSTKTRNGRQNFPVAPRPGQTEYLGWIPENNAETGVVVTLRGAVQLTTNGAGFLLSVQNADPTSLDNFPEYATIFEEYRVLGIKYHYYPTHAVNSAAVGGGQMVSSILHTELSPTPGNLTEAFSYGDARIGNVFRPWIREWKMSGTLESNFEDTNVSSNHKAIMVVIDQGAATLAYGVMYVTALVQFRTTRK
jgi:hypothetical protein